MSKKTTQCFRPGLKPGPLDPEISARVPPAKRSEKGLERRMERANHEAIVPLTA